MPDLYRDVVTKENTLKLWIHMFWEPVIYNLNC
jgi:hypothetical protein